ncbi:hypothetical protein OAH72_01685 [Gammaproteobacteria bacterium]|nr:hypothetical protein [Porticoccaceae bacterium]MDB4850645.1 hypothetical protein [Gammaproteobacteria bacterium]
MNRFKTSPVQHINRPAAPEGGGNPLLGALGGAIGGALLAPLGPLGMAVGSSVGSSLAGKGDLSQVTPENVALGTLTANIPIPGAADAVTDVAKDVAVEGAKDVAVEGAKSAAVEGAKDAVKPSFLRSIFSPDGLTNMAKDSADGYIKNPDTVAELGINKLAGGLGRVKDSLFGAKPATLANGGPVETTGPGGTGGVGYNNPQEDYSDSVKRAKLLKGVLAGGGLMGLLDLMGDERMNLAKGGYAGKGCGCGPMANCNC